MKPLILTCALLIAVNAYAQDVAGHRIEALREIAERFLRQFDDPRDDETAKIRTLLNDNGVMLWDSGNAEIKKTVGEETYTIGGWAFSFWQLNLTGVMYSKPISHDLGEILIVTLNVRNEQVRFHSGLFSEGDDLNAGLYFIEDWSIAVKDREAQSTFSIDRDAYWKQRQTPRIEVKSSKNGS